MSTDFSQSVPIHVKLSDASLVATDIPAMVPTKIDPNDPVLRIARNDSAPKVSIMAKNFSAGDLQRKSQIERCLKMYYRMPVDTSSWRPWTIMHGLLPYGQLSRVTHNGKLYSAVDYLCSNAIGNDTRMMYLSGNNKFGVSVGPGVQGHEGQFLAMLAQSDVSPEQQIHVKGRTFSVQDLIEYEKTNCKPNTELTFKLIGLSHYLDSDETWTSKYGQRWNIERLIYEEIKQPINGAACGGTHRLMGLSYAVQKRSENEKPIVGQWARAQNFIAQYQSHAMRYRNRDGSFSTNWFVTQEADFDLKKRLYTTGHIVEWLAFSLPEDQLGDKRLQHSIDYLLNLMLSARAMDLETGPKGHAIHGLRLYEERYFGANSDVTDISPEDLATVERALLMQKQMKPSFSSPIGGTPTYGVSYPGSNGINNPGRGFFGRR